MSEWVEKCWMSIYAAQVWANKFIIDTRYNSILSHFSNLRSNFIFSCNLTMLARFPSHFPQFSEFHKSSFSAIFWSRRSESSLLAVPRNRFSEEKAFSSIKTRENTESRAPIKMGKIVQKRLVGLHSYLKVITDDKCSCWNCEGKARRRLKVAQNWNRKFFSTTYYCDGEFLLFSSSHHIDFFISLTASVVTFISTFA